ncbi:MAG: DUF262 domain-containing protein [Hydrogenophaga sp.]|uniref:DUF262 domain-containing protein n=1 Tax=Hydrogenophaga sp. TaxID=1904254 RepID=UPI0040365B0B
MLKVSLHDPHTLKWWNEQFLSDNIDMDPPYQRKADIWSNWKRAHLIDSIINELDVPKFYIANFSLIPSKESNKALNKHKRRYAIIDGKQRFGAIFKFFNDEVQLNPSCVLDDDPTISLGKLYFSDLKSRYPFVAERFMNFVPTVMNVVASDQHKIDDLFVRLNMGEATTGAERRNAMAGPVPAITRDLAEHPFFTSKISFNVKRMQEFNLVAKLLMFEFEDGFSDTKAKNLDDFAAKANAWAVERQANGNSTDEGPYAQARDRVYAVLEALKLEFNDKDEVLKKQGEIPIYYWFARQHPSWVNELRDFVLDLNTKLLENLREQRVDPAAGDPELTAYYTMGRTTNDQGSLDGRYKIFVKRFKLFRQPRRN